MVVTRSKTHKEELERLINPIVESAIDETSFCEALHALINMVPTRGDGDAISMNDTWPTVERLKTKAAERVRDWFLTKIGGFCLVDHHQQNQTKLLEVRYLFKFLKGYAPAMANEVQEEYIEATSKMFFSYFRAYAARLFRLSMKDVATKDDLLGSLVPNEIAPKVLDDTFTIICSRNITDSRVKPHLWCVSDRKEIMNEQVSHALIDPFDMTQNQQSYQFEALFRSFQLAFVDHYSHEFMFVCDFFLVANAEAAEFHARAMARAASVVLKTCEEQIVLNWDAISLHLCICLTSKFHAIIKEREVPDVAGYWENLKDILFTRLDQVMAAHNESIRTVDLSHFQQNGRMDWRPHFIIRRYAELTSSHLTIAKTSQEPIHDEMQAILVNSEDSMEQLLARMSAIQGNELGAAAFIINNTDMVLGIIDDGESNNNRIHASVLKLQKANVDQMVEKAVKCQTGEIEEFLKNCENSTTAGDRKALDDAITQFFTKFAAICDEMNKESAMITQQIVSVVVNTGTAGRIASRILLECMAVFDELHGCERFKEFRENAAFAQVYGTMEKILDEQEKSHQ